MKQNKKFESSVNSYGGQTMLSAASAPVGFESSVNSYGGQTSCCLQAGICWFESSVNSYGGQTGHTFKTLQT